MSRPLVIAHRTCPLDAPENSLAGIRKAAELGADAVEVDVRAARGGEPVLGHDRTAWRLARHPLPVRLSSPAALAKVRRRLPDVLPPLGDALGALPPGLLMALDVKAPSAMRRVVDTCLAAGMTDRVLLWCRDARALALARRRSPRTPTALLRNTFDPEATARYVRDAVDAGATAVSLHERAVTPESVTAAREAGLTVYGWALSPESQDRLLDARVDGVVTDWPAAALEGSRRLRIDQQRAGAREEVRVAAARARLAGLA